MSSLYELNQNWQQVMQMLDDPEVPEEAIRDTIESIGGDIEQKADGYAIVMKNLDADVTAIKTEIDRLTERKKSLENKKESMKDMLYNTMKLTGKIKFKTVLFSYNIQNNPPSVDIPDENKVPKVYRLAQPDKIDRKSIIEFLKTGIKVDYASIKQGESLRIK